MKIDKVRIHHNGDNCRILIPMKIIKNLNIDVNNARFVVTYENGNLRIKIDENGEFYLSDGKYINFHKVFSDYILPSYKSIELKNENEIWINKNEITTYISGNIQLTRSFMLILEIRKLHQQGVKLTQANIKTNYPTLISRGRASYGTWRKSVEAAGLKYPEREYKKGYVSPKLKYTKETAIKELKRLHDEGVILTSGNIAKLDQSLYNATRYNFNSWKDVIEELQINYIEELKKSSINLRTCGHIFEAIVDELFLELAVQYKKYNSGYRNLNPDYIFNEYHWGDAKLSEWTINHGNVTTVEKYEKRCKLLTIVYFRGNNDMEKMVTKKTRLISVYKLLKQLPKHRIPYYFDKLDSLEKLMMNSDEQLKFSKGTKESLHNDIESCLQNINYQEYEIIKYNKSKTPKFLTPEKVIQIKELLRNGFRICEITRYFDIEKTTVRDIRNNKIWKGIIHTPNTIQNIQ